MPVMEGKCRTRLRAIYTFPISFLCLLFCSRPPLVSADYGLCEFNAFLATCSVHIVDVYPAELTIIFNQCHKPIDITFILEGMHKDVHWKYTYVTTNEVEIREVPKFISGHTVALRVRMESIEDAVNVTADFLLDGEQDAVVMNTTVLVPTFDVCMHIGNNVTGRILLGVLLASVLALLCSFVTTYACRHRVSSKSDRFPLVDDAEAVARASTSFMLLVGNNNGNSASSSPDEPEPGLVSPPKEQVARCLSQVAYQPIANAVAENPSSVA